MVTSMRKTKVIEAGYSMAVGEGRCGLPTIRRDRKIMGLVFRAYWRWRYREMTLRLLRSMDERQLRDIGVDPLNLRSFWRKDQALREIRPNGLDPQV
jgi:uncharacterized protein YjiS (DUF1127 family)